MLTNHTDANNILEDYQFGVRPKLFLQLRKLAKVRDFILDNYNKNSHTGVVSLDVKKKNFRYNTMQ